MPKDKAEEGLKVTQDIDAKETKMVPFIKSRYQNERRTERERF
ncbi:hypothetical protein ACFL6U_03245 [Planctomycetota bacterium]